jgi:large subunit ribosomal protein L17
MRHNKSGRRLGRNSSHRSAMMRNMTISLISHEKIQTTDARAKELRKIVERMITLGKRGDLHARRQAYQALNDKTAVARLFDMVAPRYKERNGGYTRIIKLNPRLGDNAPQAVIELVEEEFTPRPRKKAPVAQGAATPAAPVIVAAAAEAEEKE